MADELTIQEAHEETGVARNEIARLVAGAGIDPAELKAFVEKRTEHARVTGYATVPAVISRAFVAGVLWEKSRG